MDGSDGGEASERQWSDRACPGPCSRRYGKAFFVKVTSILNGCVCLTWSGFLACLLSAVFEGLGAKVPDGSAWLDGPRSVVLYPVWPDPRFPPAPLAYLLAQVM